jgi:osmotically-inducible protein OsmY
MREEFAIRRFGRSEAGSGPHQTREIQMKIKTLTTMALLGAVLFSGSAAIAADNQADWTTQLNVKMALLEKLGKDSLHIEIAANAGDLILTGTVDKRETRELAETIAKSVASVKGVNNEIKLDASVMNPSKTSVAVGESEAEVKDAMLSTKIRLVLVDKMGNDGFDIGTEVADGVVTLEFEKGFTSARRTEATKLVKGVEGVSKVVSVDKA